MGSHLPSIYNPRTLRRRRKRHHPKVILSSCCNGVQRSCCQGKCPWKLSPYHRVRAKYDSDLHAVDAYLGSVKPNMRASLAPFEQKLRDSLSERWGLEYCAHVVQT